MNRSKISLLLTTLLIALTFTSCVKKDFDNPPSTNVDPDIKANKTIAQIKALYVAGAVTTINSDYIIKGVVVGDDHSGNIYKNVIIQDSTGGISIAIDLSNYYTIFKVGRNVFVKCKGLVIGDYHKLIQIGGYADNSSGTPSVGRIPQSLIGQHLFAGKWMQPYTTKIVSDISTLNTDLDQNTLVRIDGARFETPCLPWADVVNQTSSNRNLKDAHGNTIVVYTSNYATFASSLIPGSTGSVIGVFQVYGNSKQLIIRDLADVLMAPSSCNNGPVGTGALMSVGGIRSLYSGLGNSFVAGTKIRGTVISDKNGANINGNNIILQDGTSGIMVRFLSPNTFNLNDSIEINLTGDSLVTYQSGIEINYVPNANATLLGTGTVIPRVVTTAYVLSNLPSLESTLIKITGAGLSGGTAGTYSGSVNVTDATGTLIMYTRAGATFSGNTYPTGAVSVTGFLSNFNGTPELILRNASDVQ